MRCKGPSLINYDFTDMKFLISILVTTQLMNAQVLFDFSKNSDIRDWRIVDDVVMGGRSSGTFKLNEEGYGLFEGSISLENNGGFSSVRYRFKKMQINDYTRIVIKLKGDGKKYQFRIKDESDKYYSYVSTFLTSGDWQEIEIPLGEMYPTFRGRRLDQPNFTHDSIEELAFLIANKKTEKFKLIIDTIELR